MILQPVPLERLHDVWGWVRDGLWTVKDKCNEPWLPEDIYAAIKSGVAFLYTVGDAGFFVFQKHTDVDGPVLFVWIMHGKLKPLRAQIEADVDELGRGIGARRIRYYSPRKGHAKLGYAKMKTTIYEREL